MGWMRIGFIVDGRMMAEFEDRISLYLSLTHPVTSHWFVK